MLKADTFDSVFEGLGYDTPDTQDDSISQDAPEHEYFDGGEESETESGTDNKHQGSWDKNHELRLVNAYFKEVGLESLLTQEEEIQIAAKLKECEAQSLRVKKAVSHMIGRELPQERSALLNELKILTQVRIQKLEKKKCEKDRLRKLVLLLESYMREENRLKNRFIKANLRLVASLAKKYAGRGVPFLDLIQDGNIGLIKAVEKFDHTRGYRFCTYAYWWINQSMLRGLTKHTRTVRIPAYVLEKAGKVWAERAKFIEETGREPHPQEIASSVDMSVAKVKQIMESGHVANMVRLDSPVWAGEKTTYMDYIPDVESMQVDSLIAEVSIPESIGRALEMLGMREREIIKMRFGIGYQGSFTLDEIGKRFNLTKERIRQIEKRALSTIRHSESAPALRSLIEH
jgi:RNA polymerase primary sigma factor